LPLILYGSEDNNVHRKVNPQKDEANHARAAQDCQVVIPCALTLWPPASLTYDIVVPGAIEQIGTNITKRVKWRGIQICKNVERYLRG